MKYPEVLTVSIQIDRSARAPLARQIADQLTTAVATGRIAGGTRMPSTRTLCELLGVSRGVTVAAYDLLLHQGTFEGRRGSGTYVAWTPPSPPRPRSGHDTVLDLRPGQVTMESFPLEAWRTAWRQATFRCPPGNPSPLLGLPELRAAIAEHVHTTRGVTLEDHEVVVTSGLSDAVRIALDTFGGPIGLPEVLAPAVRAGIGGSNVTTAGSVRTKVLSPDAEPLSGRPMPAQDRLSAARWSLRDNGYLVELACDAVFRPMASSLPRLPELAPDRVAVVGGFDLLTPAVGIGYALVPKSLGSPIVRYGKPPAYVPQRAMAALLAGGSVKRMMHRNTRSYQRKEHLVREVLADLSPAIRIGGFDASANVALHLPPGVGANVVADLLGQRGIVVSTLDAYYAPGRAPSGLIIGFAQLSDADLPPTFHRVISVLNALDGPL